MVPDLPEDILHLLCAELFERRDFGTLFNCCSTAKTLAEPALTALYRAQHVATVKTDSGNETLGISMAEQDLLIRRWSILWRSIILSALGKTVLPYCRHIRVLDLDDLKLLLEEDRFRGDTSANFFSGELAKFKIFMDVPLKTRSGRPRAPRLNLNSIVDAVGELITQHAPMLEVINGPLLPTTLVKWIPRVPKLRSLQVWDGRALNDKRIPALIRQYCPKFEALAFYTWTEDSVTVDPKSDHTLANFFSGLPEQRITSFTTFSRSGFGPESCLALNSHGNSLKTLDIQLDANVLPHLGYLKGCTALETLRLHDNDMTIDLESSQHDVFLEVIAWLIECRNLHTLVLDGFTSGAALTTPLLIDEGIRLQVLEINHYAVKDQSAFHGALRHQPGLQSLALETEPIGDRDGLDLLADSLCQLKQLRLLRLIGGISAMFNYTHISSISENLELLEDLYVAGLGLGDDSLKRLASLNSLKSVALAGITTFTLEGILDFIAKLGPGNRGLVLAIDNADPDSALSDSEQAYVRQTLAKQIDGRMDYTLFRDPDVSDFEGESD